MINKQSCLTVLNCSIVTHVNKLANEMGVARLQLGEAWNKLFKLIAEIRRGDGGERL